MEKIFTLTARYHPRPKEATRRFLGSLDPLDRSHPDTLIAASSRYSAGKAERPSNRAMAQAWMVRCNGILAAQIFDIPEEKAPVAALAMIHIEQDAILRALGMQVATEFLDQPYSGEKDEVQTDLICLRDGIMALRCVPDATRSPDCQNYESKLTKMAAAFVCEDIQPEKLNQTLSDMSDFLSAYVSTRPKIHEAMGLADPVPQTRINVIAPEPRR